MRKSLFARNDACNSRLWVMLAVLALCAQCDKGSPLSGGSSLKNQALVVVIENNDYLGEDMETGFMFFRDEVSTVLAEIFGIAVSDMDGMTLTKIIDVYGEDWQINEIRTRAAPYYARIVSLTDDAATGSAVLDTLDYLSGCGYIIDMVFNLHGNTTGVSFADSHYDISAFTDSLNWNGVRLRALYQTCCYGRHMIDEWESCGISAVNGAHEINGLAMFSPVFFVEHWAAGATFGGAVSRAFQDEIDTLESYGDVLPVDALLSDEVRAGSAQHVGGSDTALAWADTSMFGTGGLARAGAGIR
ncbi:MAG: hypothetical protein GF418_07275 [Chitinivibrionales bacterium]|nr:hypothetical protein [Chitinivibrionales bacterium]MBD3395412.1 hypothetical protein [Chitinivibrionales bacterium]